MPIKYALFENNLTSDPDDFNAIVQENASVATEQLIDRIIDQGSTVTRADIKAVFEDMMMAVKAELLAGNRVVFAGMFEAFPRVQGVFTSAMDTFDPTRHRVDVGMNIGEELRKEVRAAATVEKVEAIKPAPVPIEFIDLASGTTNSTLTPGNIGTVNGHRLKIDLVPGDESLQFLDALTSAVAATVTTFQKNKPSQLVFLNPALAPGAYRLVVRNRQRGGTEIRIGLLDQILTVV